MSISKRNFEAIALAFRRVRNEEWTDPQTALDQLAEQLATVFEGENEYFQRERFLERCGHSDFCPVCLRHHYRNAVCSREALDRQYRPNPLLTTEENVRASKRERK